MRHTHPLNVSGLLPMIATMTVANIMAPYGSKGKLKASITHAEYEKLNDQLKDFYDGTEEDGYTLSTDDKSYKAKLDEFRVGNLNLKRQQEELTKALEKFKDIDPERAKEAQEALDFLQQNEEAQLIKAGKFDEVIQKRTARMQEDFNKRETALKKQLDEATKGRDDLGGKYKGLKLDTEFTTLLNGVAQVRKGAMPDLLRRARDAWDLDKEDGLTFRDSDALDANGKPWTPESWAKQLVNDAPFFFEQGTGSGAGGSSKGVTTTGGRKLLINPTPLEMGQHADAIAKGEMEVVRR